MYQNVYGKVTIQCIIHDSYTENMSKISNIIIAAFLLLLGLYLMLVESIELPSRYGSGPSILSPPVTYMMSILPLAFSISIILSLIDREKYKKLCNIIVAIGVVSIFIGLVIVAPLLKAM